MKNKTDKNMPIGKLTRVVDLLPPPEKLKIPDTKLKKKQNNVTLSTKL